MFGDFNVLINENHMEFFWENYGPTNLIKQPRCYKNLTDPKCIVLLLAYLPQSFESTCVVELRLSDFHLMTMTAM